MSKFKEYSPKSQAKALEDIDVFSRERRIFSCRKNEVLNFKEIVYNKTGSGFLIFSEEIKLPLEKFKII